MVAHQRLDWKHEWSRRDLSKQELAEVLAELLTDMGFRCE
jgi:hypothetical protein